MNKGLPDGIEQGDHAREIADDRNVKRGCMVIIMVFTMLYGTGVLTGWALTMAFGK
jgi:hypothetical protein